MNNSETEWVYKYANMCINMQKLSCLHWWVVIKDCHWSKDVVSSLTWFENDQAIWFSHCAGEIFDYLLANGRMKERDVRIKFRQVRFHLFTAEMLLTCQLTCWLQLTCSCLCCYSCSFMVGLSGFTHVCKFCLDTWIDGDGFAVELAQLDSFNK